MHFCPITEQGPGGDPAGALLENAEAFVFA